VVCSDIGGILPSSISPVGVKIENLRIFARSDRFGGFLRIELITGGGKGSLSGSGHNGSGTIAEQIYSQRKVKLYSILIS